MSDWLGLRGKSAVVTGGSSGVGEGVALALAEVGVNVTVLGRDVDRAQDVAQRVSAFGVTGNAVACEVSDEKSVNAAAEEIGTVDILVNVAGIVRPGGLSDLSLDEWNQLLSVNLTGYFLTSRAFSHGMIEQGSGAMVHVSSISAANPQAFSGAYSVSKAGIVLMSKQLSMELGPKGIRSNTVSPGLVRTPMTEAYYNVGDVAERRDRAIPIGRVARPDDIADVCVYLASPRARYITGADITADGGFSQTLMASIPRPGFSE